MILIALFFLSFLAIFFEPAISFWADCFEFLRVETFSFCTIYEPFF